MAELTKSPSYRVSVSQTDGRIQTTAPLSLRNVVRDQAFLRRIEDIENVTAVNKIDGATLVYNSENQKYEIKLADLDGGFF
jgi:hypothetical protein